MFEHVRSKSKLRSTGTIDVGSYGLETRAIEPTVFRSKNRHDPHEPVMKKVTLEDKI
jgi:hypothetical protein